jgi:HEPN domain-containing protein
MIAVENLHTLALARIKDAEVLLSAGRFDGAVYLCGYAIEFALKGRICRTLNWSIYPSEKGFADYRTFQTHNLDVLLHLSGLESKVKNEYLAEWSQASTWDTASRYRIIGSASSEDAQFMLESVKKLLEVL